MAVPRGKISRHSRGGRRSHHAKDPVFACTCENCKNSKMPNRVCLSCGFYKGKSVLKTEQAQA